MELYAKGDKTSCQLAKDVLREELRLLHDEYFKRGQQCYKDGDQLGYLEWDNKAVGVLDEIHKITNMDCNDLVSFASNFGIDLVSEVRKQYLGIIGELKKKIIQTGVGQLFSNLSGASHIINHLENYTSSMVNQWNTYIDGLVEFSTDYVQTSENTFIVPWYFDKEAGQQYASIIINGNEPPEDIRIPMIIEYENAVYEYFIWVLKNVGETALCQYINSFGNQMPENIATNTIAIQVYTAQIRAFSQIENWDTIAMSCLDENGNIVK